MRLTSTAASDWCRLATADEPGSVSSYSGSPWSKAGADSPPLSSSGEVRHMEQKASVIVVGAGVIGCSVAFQLARMGARDVVVLEREPLPGTGSTSRANGGIRAQFTTQLPSFVRPVCGILSSCLKHCLVQGKKSPQFSAFFYVFCRFATILTEESEHVPEVFKDHLPVQERLQGKNLFGHGGYLL